MKKKKKEMNDSNPPKTAVERAAEFGIDISLLIENLKLAPSERLRRAQQALKPIPALREESERARSRLKASP